MRRLLVLAVFFSCVLGCSKEDPAALFMDFNYQVRCIDCEPRSNDEPARDIRAVDGEDDLTLTCTLLDRGGERFVSFSLEHANEDADDGVDYSFALEQVNLASGDPGSGCRVKVKEGNNLYEGLCTGDDPTDDVPCQVEVEEEGDGIKGSVHCVHIPNKAQSTITRHIATPSTEKAAKFEVTGCGL